jgi:hypothetical protein
MADGHIIYATMIRNGNTTYFVDLKEAKSGKKYVNISQNTLTEGAKGRITIRVFEDVLPEFAKAVNEAAEALKT